MIELSTDCSNMSALHRSITSYRDKSLSRPPPPRPWPGNRAVHFVAPLLLYACRKALCDSPPRPVRGGALVCQPTADTLMRAPALTRASTFTSPSTRPKMLHGDASRVSSPSEIGVRPKP